ncbi:glycoprotein integral membrane protein 1 isoform X2 [Spea bombifrons]|uniref:glycoprotein integral membrane protein 1 isoform X2 n=1 Tax=Spea bombifrons TaxID=233779 RepID=UPI002348F062|nr:glycoprotein integral membrane protein 1 isoform X2 [Spea bombifrons]
MVHCLRVSRPSWIFLLGSSCLLLTILPGGQGRRGARSIQEPVRLDVTVQVTENVSEKVTFNIGYSQGQILVNGFPINKGVTRISSNMEIWSSNEWRSQTRIGLACLRLLVQEWPTNSSSRESQILVEPEVIEIDGKQVEQNMTTDVTFVINEETGLFGYSTSIIPREESLLYIIPRANDVLFTFSNIPESGDSAPQHTTWEYNIRQNTTMDEEPYPGKLPETPIRAEMPSSSYKVMCQFAEELREKLCIIWRRCYPVLIDLAQVVIMGVIAAAIVLEILKIVYPSGGQKYFLTPSDIKDSPVLVPLVLQEREKIEKSNDTESNQ